MRGPSFERAMYLHQLLDRPDPIDLVGLLNKRRGRTPASPRDAEKCRELLEASIRAFITRRLVELELAPQFTVITVRPRRRRRAPRPKAQALRLA